MSGGRISVKQRIQSRLRSFIPQLRRDIALDRRALNRDRRFQLLNSIARSTPSP